VVKEKRNSLNGADPLFYVKRHPGAVTDHLGNNIWKPLRYPPWPPQNPMILIVDKELRSRDITGQKP
jgi:hypothetical protein